MMLDKIVAEFVRQYGLGGQKLIVGVSGGMDSLALLHGLRNITQAHLIAVHVDHGLRENSAEDARYVKQICANWDIPCIIKKLSLQSDSEETARRERYRILSEVAQEQGVEVIVTAHHADDQVETVLMNILRGTGSDGLSGMAAVSAVPYGIDLEQKLYRPLLTLPRAEIVRYCQQNNIQFVEDPTNLERRYFRNRVRHELLPILEEYTPQVRRRLLQLAAVSSADSALLHTLTEKSCATLLIDSGKNWLEFDLVAWRALPLGLRRRTLRYALHTLDETLIEIGFTTVEVARNVAENGQVGKRVALPNGWQLTVGYTRLLISRRGVERPLDVPQIKGEVALPVPGEVELGAGWWLSAEIVQAVNPYQESSTSNIVHIPYLENLVVRGRRSGERVHPFGASGSAKLKRIMIDRKIPQRVRENWPLVVADNKVIWLVGEVLSELGRVETNSTVQIRLQLKQEENFSP